MTARVPRCRFHNYRLETRDQHCPFCELHEVARRNVDAIQRLIGALDERGLKMTKAHLENIEQKKARG